MQSMFIWKIHSYISYKKMTYYAYYAELQNTNMLCKQYSVEHFPGLDCWRRTRNIVSHVCADVFSGDPYGRTSWNRLYTKTDGFRCVFFGVE